MSENNTNAMSEAERPAEPTAGPSKLEEELANEIAFNDISDLLDAMKPFVRLVKETDGHIPTERLSFANWHQLSKAFDAAVFALNQPQTASKEKERRIYYQDIVYAVCNLIDRHRRDKRKTVAGTIGTPSTDVQESLASLLSPSETAKEERR